MILALDVSTVRTGFALMDGDALVLSGAWETPGQRLQARVHGLWKAVEDWLWCHSRPPNSITDVVYEEGVFCPGAAGRMSLGAAQGAILIAAHARKIPAHPLKVQTWRRLILGNGGAKKEDVCRYVHEHYPAVAPDATDDELEAIAIGRAWALAQEQAEKSKPTRKKGATK